MKNKFKFLKDKNKGLDLFAKVIGFRERKTKKFLCFTIKESNKLFRKAIASFMAKNEKEKKYDFNTESGISLYLYSNEIESIIDSRSIPYTVNIYVLKDKVEETENIINEIKRADLYYKVIAVN